MNSQESCSSDFYVPSNSDDCNWYKNLGKMRRRKLAYMAYDFAIWVIINGSGKYDREKQVYDHFGALVRRFLVSAEQGFFLTTDVQIDVSEGVRRPDVLLKFIPTSKNIKAYQAVVEWKFVKKSSEDNAMGLLRERLHILNKRCRDGFSKMPEIFGMNLTKKDGKKVVSIHRAKSENIKFASYVDYNENDDEIIKRWILSSWEVDADNAGWNAESNIKYICSIIGENMDHLKCFVNCIFAMIHTNAPLVDEDLNLLKTMVQTFNNHNKLKATIHINDDGVVIFGDNEEDAGRPDDVDDINVNPHNDDGDSDDDDDDSADESEEDLDEEDLTVKELKKYAFPKGKGIEKKPRKLEIDYLIQMDCDDKWAFAVQTVDVPDQSSFLLSVKRFQIEMLQEIRIYNSKGNKRNICQKTGIYPFMQAHGEWIDEIKEIVPVSTGIPGESSQQQYVALFERIVDSRRKRHLQIVTSQALGAFFYWNLLRGCRNSKMFKTFK